MNKNKVRVVVVAAILVVIVMLLAVESQVEQLHEYEQEKEPVIEMIDTTKASETDTVHKISRDMQRILQGGEPVETYKTPIIRGELVKYYKSLQEKETSLIDLDMLVSIYSEDNTGTGDSYVYEFEETEEEDTEELHESGGVTYIRTKDLEFDAEDTAMVIYKGRKVYIHKSMVEYTYTEIQEMSEDLKVEKVGDTIILKNKEGTIEVEVYLRMEGVEVETIEISKGV